MKKPVAGELLFRPFSLRILWLANGYFAHFPSRSQTQCNIVTLRSELATRSIRQGQAIGVMFRPVVMSENPANHVFVDWDVERQGDLLGDSRTAPIGITLLHFDDRMNEIYARSFRTGLPTAIRGEEHPVLLLAQNFVKP